MMIIHFKTGFQKLILFVFMCLFPLADNCANGEKVVEKQINVVMRTIGHEVLNCSGDYKSRIMPINKIEDQYKIAFEKEFGFDPEDIISIVDRVLKEAKVANNFLVEIEQCDTKEVVHSFISGYSVDPNSAACRGRILPKDCYSLLITVLDEANNLANLNAVSSVNAENILDSNDQQVKSNKREGTLLEAKRSNPLNSTFLLLPLIFLIGLIGFVFNKKIPLQSNRQLIEKDPNLVSIGASQFDKRNMVLSFENEKVDLSHKETELLSLLYASANAPIEREIILQKVWGDEGDYVGRTLDVFISKLRKKLEADGSVKIVNIRGIGYKLVMDISA